MLKEKVIIFGLGKDYKLYKEDLEERFDVIAYTDNYNDCDDMEVKHKYINANQIKDLNYDKIIICTRIYYKTIKYQLMHEYGVLQHKIFPAYNGDIGESHETEEAIFETVEQYRNMSKDHLFKIADKSMWLICNDYHAPAGNINYHYFPQDIWAAKKIYNQRPDRHYDIGSRLDGFISHLLVFMQEVNYIDIRPLPYEIEGLKFMQGDATNLEGIEDNSLESISSLHAVEHFGLGRYGDEIDPDACFKAMKAFSRVLKKGGHLYFGVPVGPENKLIFNAHRIFQPQTIIDKFKDLKLIDAAFIDNDSLNLTNKAALKVIPLNTGETLRIDDIQEYRCGLFEFIKE